MRACVSASAKPSTSTVASAGPATSSMLANIVVAAVGLLDLVLRNGLREQAGRRRTVERLGTAEQDADRDELRLRLQNISARSCRARVRAGCTMHASSAVQPSTGFCCQSSMTPRTSSNSSVPTSDTRIEPPQPRRFEKKNITGRRARSGATRASARSRSRARVAGSSRNLVRERCCGVASDGNPGASAAGYPARGGGSRRAGEPQEAKVAVAQDAQELSQAGHGQLSVARDGATAREDLNPRSRRRARGRARSSPARWRHRPVAGPGRDAPDPFRLSAGAGRRSARCGAPAAAMAAARPRAAAGAAGAATPRR